MKDLLGRPGFLGTHATLGADVSFLLAVVFTFLFLIGWYFAKKRQGSRHHTIVLWGMVSMLIYFTGYYQIRGLGVLVSEGREGFGGPDWVYSYVFKPTLTIHILLVSIGIIMAVYMIVLGFRASYKIEGKWQLREGSDLRISERNFYKYLLIILAVLALITVIRCGNSRCATVYVIGYLIIAAVFFLERLVEKLFPVGAKRHRLLGGLTMVMYFIVLLTTTLTYALLYIFYTPGGGVPCQ
ncbi:MAG: DUF420 domain-containing protein [Nitrospinota bacterium]